MSGYLLIIISLGLTRHSFKSNAELKLKTFHNRWAHTLTSCGHASLHHYIWPDTALCMLPAASSTTTFINSTPKTLFHCSELLPPAMSNLKKMGPEKLHVYVVLLHLFTIWTVTSCGCCCLSPIRRMNGNLQSADRRHIGQVWFILSHVVKQGSQKRWPQASTLVIGWNLSLQMGHELFSLSLSSPILINAIPHMSCSPANSITPLKMNNSTQKMMTLLFVERSRTLPLKTSPIRKMASFTPSS